MNTRVALLSLLFVDFMAATAWTLYDFGPANVYGYVFENSWTMLASFDLLLALGVGAWWTWRDAKRRGLNPVPYLALTALTGSGGLLAYLIRREWSPAPTAGRASAAA